jgi:hypothetical protein
MDAVTRRNLEIETSAGGRDGVHAWRAPWIAARHPWAAGSCAVG